MKKKGVTLKHRRGPAPGSRVPPPHYPAPPFYPFGDPYMRRYDPYGRDRSIFLVKKNIDFFTAIVMKIEKEIDIGLAPGHQRGQEEGLQDVSTQTLAISHLLIVRKGLVQEIEATEREIE